MNHPPGGPRTSVPAQPGMWLTLTTKNPYIPKGTPMPLEAGLLEILACPACHAPLREENATEETPELVCEGASCGLAYPVRDEIPVLLVDEARRPA